MIGRERNADLKRPVEKVEVDDSDQQREPYQRPLWNWEGFRTEGAGGAVNGGLRHAFHCN